MKVRKQVPFAFGAPGGPRVSHLLLVAGPSGAGKSTFLKKLAAGDLPHEIAAALPPEAGSWMQTNGIKVVRKGGRRVHRHGGRISGLVLHYDIMRPWESPIADYGEDRSLAALSAADAITMVELRPDPASLAAQLTARARGGQTAEEWAARLRKRSIAALRSAARQFSRLGSGDTPASRAEAFRLKERHAGLVRRYAETGFLDAWYARFEAFIGDAVGNAVPLRIVRVEPAWAAGQRATFRLIGKPAGMHEES